MWPRAGQEILFGSRSVVSELGGSSALRLLNGFRV